MNLRNQNNEMMTRYLRDIAGFPLLTPEQEKRLSKIICNSKDKSEVRKARNTIVEGNLRMVVKLANEIYNSIEGMSDTNVSIMDLIQAGNIGLMRAATLFDYKKNYRFSSYAYPSIRRKIGKAVKLSHFVRIPLPHFKYLSELNGLEGTCNVKTLTDEKIKDELGITSDMLAMIRNERYAKSNIEESEFMMESVVNEDEIPLNKQIGDGQLKHYLYEKIKELEPFYRDVLFYRFFGGFTLRKIGNKFGVSAERVRQVIRLALKKMRKKIERERSVSNTKLKTSVKDI